MSALDIMLTEWATSPDDDPYWTIQIQNYVDQRPEVRQRAIDAGVPGIKRTDDTLSDGAR